MTAGAASAPWRGECFGLAVESTVPFVGCAGGAVSTGRPRVRMELAEPATVNAAVPQRGAEVIARLQTAPGRWREHVRGDPTRGYVLTSYARGAYYIDAGAEHVLAAPAKVATWRWQRAVGGEVLPFAAVLRGLEPLHAGGVVLPGGRAAIAVSGGSGAGKTSITADLVLAGCAFLADDVVAVEPDRGELVAHPALPLLSLRAVTVDRLGENAVGRLGPVIGRDTRGLRIAVSSRAQAARLAALYLLSPERTARRPALVHVENPGIASLLATTFNVALQTPARLLAQFEAAAAMAGGVRVVRVTFPPGAGHADVAASILADASRFA